ncbi:MAG: dioxygenase [Microbacteriaceae bacterium]|nr:dioxygenase [Microbacteriaceae bacterium]
MVNYFNPDVPAGAFDAFLPDALEKSRTQRNWHEEDGALPALYLSHGAPPLLDDSEWMGELHDWAMNLPKPRHILIVSAHWEQAPLMISSPDANTPLVYDFGGFHPRYYELTYPTPDANELAGLVASVMTDTEPLYQHPARGLDHGAWVPLKVMYPLGDVPVLQLSIPTHEPDKLMKIGARLARLREHGVLIIGSGFMTHGLPFMTPSMISGREIPSWSSEFDDWAVNALRRGDVDELATFKTSAPGMPYAHPTDEHFIPLFVTLGASTDLAVAPTMTIDGYMMGFSKRSFQTTS